jgi:hypothetical protein
MSPNALNETSKPTSNSCRLFAALLLDRDSYKSMLW